MQIQDEHIKLIRKSLLKVQDKKDLVDLFRLGENLLFGEQQPKIKLKTLTYFAHPYRAKKRYRTFTIKKKNGKDRIINAPNDDLKYILRVLNFIMQAATTPHRAATGFVLGKSIVDNARMHVGKRYVYNIDLKDFFHSFDRKRVKSVFMRKPFNFNGDKEPLAYMLSGLVTHPFEINGHKYCVLPQGSPTSPTLTNLASKFLDRRLTGLANRFGLTYTRYADDISFSSNHNVYRKKGFLDELERIITELELEINPEKTRLQYQTHQQETTGLTVNEKVNVKRRYIKQIRQWLYFWERYGYAKAQELFLKAYTADKGHVKNVKKHVPDLQNVLDGKLLYLKMVKGVSDPTYIKLQNRFNRLVLNITKDKDEKIIVREKDITEKETETEKKPEIKVNSKTELDILEELMKEFDKNPDFEPGDDFITL